MQSDRNLLIGLLAVSNGFITQDQLMSAIQSWTQDGNKSLDSILFEQEALPQDTQELIVSLAEKHLEIHGGDAEKSLASLSTIHTLREDLLRSTAFDATLSHLGSTRQHDPDATTPVEINAPRRSIRETTDRYRVIRPHARGGLGEVSVAQDLELNREVALKEIQDQFADDPNSRSRFVLEAEITGGLEHPGIVPVYGLGQYDDGRPYYAMRFIRGGSLKDATDHYYQTDTSDGSAQSFQLRKLLGRFIDVCNSIAYAHVRGVIHRDLKPGNIMLGKFGETLVVDWGLAKITDQPNEIRSGDEQLLQSSSSSNAPPTQIGNVIGTPAFMSPEQAAGELDELGPASDVYSLGATLYYVLTGQSPVTGDTLSEILDKVKNGQITSPLAIRNTVPKALDAICMRAMSTAPRDRYESPSAMADDVELFLADEPIKAFEEPLSIRARRWIRKHPKTVVALAAGLLFGFASTLVISGVVSAKNAELAETNQALDISNESLVQANTDLTHSNEKERLAKEEAQDERRIAQAVRDFFQKDLLQQADVTEQANRLASLGGAFRTAQNPTIRELLDRSAAELAPDLIDEKFPSQSLVQAEILQTIGRTYNAIGSHKKAITHLERARNLYESELGVEHPDTHTIWHELASALEGSGDSMNALLLYNQALEKRRSNLGASHPSTLRTMNNLAMAYMDAGEVHKALILHEEVVEKHVNVLGADHRDTLLSMHNLGAAYASAGKVAKALPVFDETQKRMQTTLGADHPATIASMNGLAGAYLRLNELTKARPLLEDTLERCRAVLGDNHPMTLKSMNNLAYIYEDIREFEKALQLHDEALKQKRILFGTDHPSTLTSMNNLAALHAAMGDFEKALPLMKEATDRTTELRGADHPETLMGMNNIAAVLKKMRRIDEAISIMKQTIPLWESRLGVRHPNTLLAKANLGSMYREKGDFDHAITLLEQTLPYVVTYPQLRGVVNALVDSYVKTGQNNKAVSLMADNLAEARGKLSEQSPEFASLLAKHALVLIDLSEWKAAEDCLVECLAIRKVHLANHWLFFNTKSMLGVVFVGHAKDILKTENQAALQKLTQAEALLLDGYEGLKQNENAIPAAARIRIIEAIQGLVDLYTVLEKSDDASKWQAELDRRLSEQKQNGAVR